ADRHVGGVPAELASTGGSARKGSRESAAGARATLPAAGGDGSGQRLVDQRIAHRPDRRTPCVSLLAWGTGGGDGLRRRLFGPDLLAQLGQGPVSAEHVYILETDFTAALVEHIRCARSGEMRGPTRANQHAVAGAGPHERPNLRRGCPGAGATHDRRSGTRFGRPYQLCVSISDR